MEQIATGRQINPMIEAESKTFRQGSDDISLKSLTQQKKNKIQNLSKHSNTLAETICHIQGEAHKDHWPKGNVTLCSVRPGRQSSSIFNI